MSDRKGEGGDENLDTLRRKHGGPMRGRGGIYPGQTLNVNVLQFSNNKLAPSVVALL